MESDKVLLIFNTLGTPTNGAIHKYLNERRVPHLFPVSGASKFPEEFPWTKGFAPDHHTEAVIYATHILANVGDPKIAVLMQNDDFGKDLLSGLKQGLGSNADKLVRVATYEVAEPHSRQPDHPAQGLRRQCPR